MSAANSSGTSAREEILRRVREALRDVPDDEEPAAVPVPRDYLRSHASSDVVAMFAERVEDYRATVIRAAPGDVPSAIAAALARRGARRVVIPPGFPEADLPTGDHDWIRDLPPLALAVLDTADAVLTTAALGIAVTGTIVLDAGPGQGRRALTLIPDYHLCVIRADQIHDDLPGALGALDPTRPLTFISGPSATSDIELDRVEGVHGPRTLDVVIVADPQP